MEKKSDRRLELFEFLCVAWKAAIPIFVLLGVIAYGVWLGWEL